MTIACVLEPVEDFLAPGMPFRAQFVDRAAAETAAAGAGFAGRAIKIARAVGRQQAIGISTIAAALKAVDHLFGPKRPDGNELVHCTQTICPTTDSHAVEIAASVKDETTFGCI